MMIGPELCRDERFLKETTSLLGSIFFKAIVAVSIPLGPLRGFLARPLHLTPPGEAGSMCQNATSNSGRKAAVMSRP